MDKEKQVLDKLVEALNLFIELESQHPEELKDFKEGLHKCQSVIGLRLAREYRPTYDSTQYCIHDFSNHMEFKQMYGLRYLVEECVVCGYEKQTLIR